MEKSYLVERVKSDLRNNIYDLMRFPKYHELEKNFTESLLNNTPLYLDLRKYSLDSDIPVEEKEEKRALFAYSIYLKMNSVLGGFHFNRYKSLASGDFENQQLGMIINDINFGEFLNDTAFHDIQRGEQDFIDFVSTNQHKDLEDRIVFVLKSNEIIPRVANIIASDITGMLKLEPGYTYLEIDDGFRDKTFSYGEDEMSGMHLVKVDFPENPRYPGAFLLKQVSPSLSDYRLLLTNFGTLIQGKK